MQNKSINYCSQTFVLAQIYFYSTFNSVQYIATKQLHISI